MREGGSEGRGRVREGREEVITVPTMVFQCSSATPHTCIYMCISHTIQLPRGHIMSVHSVTMCACKLFHIA